MDKSEKMLFKIEMLLRKTEENGCSPQEAANAAQLAQDLLKKYKLSIMDLPGDADDIEILEWDTTRMWEAKLFWVIAKNMCCKCHRHTENRKSKVIVMGRKTDLKAAKRLYDFLYQSVRDGVRKAKQKARTEYGSDKGIETFYTDAFFEEVDNAMQLKSKALMLVVDEEVEDRYTKEYPNVRPATMRTVYFRSMDAALAAQEAGRSLKISDRSFLVLLLRIPQ